MKFICRKCVDEGTSEEPCVLKLKKIKRDNDRVNWREALRRCPFENDTNGKFNGLVPFAEWRKK